MFRVGQKVVCVNAGLIKASAGRVSGLVEGTVYTVRWSGVYTHPEFGTASCIRLHEVVRSCNFYLISDMPSRAIRFRPLVERKTDISVFTALLNPTKQIERA